MSYTFNINKLLQDLKGPHRREALMAEVQKMKSEIEKLSRKVKPQAEAQVKKLEVRYKALLKTLGEAQSELDKEVKKTLTLVKKTAKEAEKNMSVYKKLAIKQKNKIGNALSTKKKVARVRKKPKKTVQAEKNS